MQLDCVPGAETPEDNPYEDLTEDLDDFGIIEIIKVEKNPLMLYLEVMKEHILA